MKHKLSTFIEPLESRIAPATFTVTSNADFGAGTLRQALMDAVNSMGMDTIGFNLPMTQTTIILNTTLAVDSPVIIDGGTQPGYVSTPLVTIEGAMSVGQNGVNFTAGSNGSEVHGLAIVNFDQYAISIGVSDITVAGCTITGNQIGVYVGGNNAKIGTAGATGKNVLSGNSQYGIYGTFASGLVVQNSHIGVDRSGLVAQGNAGGGIYLDTFTAPTIGGAEKNVISANGVDGIHFVDVFGDARITNSYIGLYADGTFNSQSRNLGAGIYAFGNTNLVIGTDGMTGAPNYIANNGNAAILVNTTGVMSNGTATITGNVIGSAPIMMGLLPATNVSGITATGSGIRIGGPGAESNNIAWQTGAGITSTDGKTEVRGNFFADSGGEVIDIFADGPTANDTGDFDGAQNFPVLSGGVVDAMGLYTAYGSLDSTPNTQFLVKVYGFNAPTYSLVGDFYVTTSATGHANIAQSVPSLAGFAKIAMTATSPLLHTSEMSALAPIAPGIVFSDSMIQSAPEGNTGVTFVNFTVQMTTAPAGAVSVVLSAAPGTTATLGTDYSFSPQVLNFNAGTTQQNITVAFTGDTDVEPTEFIHFILGSVMGNAVLTDSTKTLQITNDDTSLKIAPDGKTATWRDVDGDFVTLKSTKGILDAGDFTLNAEGTVGGEVLRLLDLSNDGAPAKGVGLTLTAKFDQTNNRGDGSVHVGFINAFGVDLGIVTLPGDLGRITAGDAALVDGAIKSLTVGSIGVLGTSTQAVGGNLTSTFLGKVGNLTVKGDVIAAQLNATNGMAGSAALGSFGAITITGNMESSLGYPARITATGDIASVKILGSIGTPSVGSTYMDAGGKIGSVTVVGSMRSVSLNAGTTLGKVTVGGDIENSGILAVGKAQPANAAAAIAIASLTVRGRVTDSVIFAGFGTLNGQQAQNPDAQIGAVLVGGDWVRSNMTAGVSDLLGDNIIGTADDVIHAPTSGFTDNPSIISKIASITIKGHIYGTPAAGDGFGFVAQNIGKFVRGTTAYTLRPNALPNAQPLDIFNVSLNGDVFLREVL